MPVIEVGELKKEFRHQKRERGLRGAFKSLFKREYDTKIAVDCVSFSLERGEIVGYIGPNGAGKSTTIKMLSGILVPTSGTVSVNGIIPYRHRRANAAGIGVVFGHRTQLWWDIPVSESLVLMKYMYGIPEAGFRENLAWLSDILGIGQFMDLPVRALSLGQRMRADLCAALLHNPPVIYLDEPTIGLDVVVKKAVREFILELNRKMNTTVILTTHDMRDIEQLCSRVIVIDSGRLMYDGELKELGRIYGREETLNAEIEGDPARIEKFLPPAAHCKSREGNRISISYDRTQVNSSAVLGSLMKNCRVRDFTIRETDIDEIIRRMYKAHGSGAGGKEAGHDQ